MSTVPAATSAKTHAWLRPAAGSLVSLTDDRPDASALARDPGIVLHVLRFSRPTSNAETFVWNADLLQQPRPCETAARLLEAGGIRSRSEQSPLEAGQRLATLASRLAKASRLCSPDAAWAAGLLVPLGAYLGESGAPIAAARRWLARWELPDWLQIAVGYLDLPLEPVDSLGGHRGLNRLLRSTIRAAGAGTITKNTDDFELDELAARELEKPFRFQPLPDSDEPPLLKRLLLATAAARGRTARSRIASLEERIDSLVAQVAVQHGEFEERLRDAKLESLAEFAAGASHEINNPLAVISGNAQWLRNRETDADKVQHLGTIIRQTKRIHELLTGTRHFSRPSPAQRSDQSAEEILSRIHAEFAPEADVAGIAFDWSNDSTGSIRVDAGQVRTALGHMIQNAFEAAGRGGWVKLTCESVEKEIVFAVADSGPGPSAEATEHLFDPFYSGRSAGRGRGLGLSVAWALAKNNGGTIEWAGPAADATRFTLKFPAMPSEMDASPLRHVA